MNLTDPAAKPHILLIMTDQHRGDCLGCNGHPAVETPNIDYLASRGTNFVNAYSPSPSCIPARACLMTGMDPWHTGILGMGRGQGRMGTGFAHTLPGELAKAGYHTQGIGKMHFSPQRSLLGFHHTVLDESGRAEEPGFVSDYRAWFEEHRTGPYDIVDHGIGWNSWMARPYHAPEYLHPTNWTVSEAIRFLKRRDPTMPFFLKVSFARPHSPYDPPAYYFDHYMKKEMPEPYVGEWAAMHDDPEEALRPDAWRGRRSPEEIRRARAAYCGSVAFIDSQLGRLIEALRKSGVFERTIILFMSDHGDMLGDHNLWRKTYAYEGSARIPMIVSLPAGFRKTPPVRQSRAVVTLQDVMPTLLEAAGCPIPETVDGYSLLPLVTGEKTRIREYLHGEHSTCYGEEQEMQYLTDGQYKYIWFPRTNTEQLFCLRDDRSETMDLSGDPAYRDTLSRWRDRLAEILERRNLGLAENGRLIGQAEQPPIVSPYYKARMPLS